MLKAANVMVHVKTIILAIPYVKSIFPLFVLLCVCSFVFDVGRYLIVGQ